MTSILNNDSIVPLYSQILTSKSFVPVEGYGPEADQTPTKVTFTPTADDGTTLSLEVSLVPHNMRCEPPRGYNR